MTLERLDRYLATSAWYSLFSFSVEEHILSHMSDHLPILLKVNASGRPHMGKMNGSFKFENMLCNSNECGEIINEVWSKSQPSSLSTIS
ncbi:hypothetical protein REPUB_Repub14bG0008500 [Reevesia pubescens]